MSFLQDLRHGCRTLRRVPGLVVVAVVTLALGIGANTAIFSVVYSVLLKPLVFPEPERMVQVSMAFPERGVEQASWSRGNFWDARDMVRTFEALGAVEFGDVNFTGRGEPEKLDAVRVSAGFFRVLAVPPAAGRLLRDGEDEPGGNASLVILSHRFWTRRFGADPTAVGRTMVLDGTAHEIIGVLPNGTPFLDQADVFRPLVRVANANRGSWELAVLGRLKPGVTPETALGDLRRVTRVIGQQHADTSRGLSANLGPVLDMVAGPNIRRAMWVLLGAVGFLLLIACVNLTNLLLARASGRAREIALRTALGASRSRITGLLVAESLLLSLTGGAIGLWLAIWGLELLKGNNVWGISRLDEVAINGWVLLFTTTVAVLTGVVTGMMPASQAARRDLAPALREGERGVSGSPRQQRVRAVLVATEVALTLALLVGAGLLLRSFAAVLNVDRGFHTERRVMVEVNLPAPYSAGEGERAVRFMSEFEARVRSLAPVISVAAVSGRPMSPSSTGMGIVAAERPDAEREIPWASWRLITKDYFKALGVPLQRGRTFDEHDLLARPWRILVSQRLAERLWPGQDPVGRQAILWRGQGNRPAEVVGVVGDMRERGLSEPPTLAVYLPAYGSGESHLYFAIHTRATVDALAPMLRTTLSGLDPDLPLGSVQTLDEIVSASTASRRFNVVLLSAFAAIALALALVGIFGVTSYAVSRQTAEIGVRLALGASHRRVFRDIVLQGMKPVVAGVVAGGVGAMLLARLMASLLFGVTSDDPLTYAAVAGLLMATAVVACMAPALQAMRVDVSAALRGD